MNEEKSAQPLHDFVIAMEQLMLRAKAASPSEMAQQTSQWVALHPQHAPESAISDRPLCVIVSPHPDDECINGGLPLRLMQESGWRVVSIAVTHGRDRKSVV